MRTVTYGGACSLDGFIAGPNGSLDWLHMSKDVNAIIAEYWKGIDTLVMGRKTWEIAQGQFTAELSKADRDSHVQSYVFSRTLRAIDCPGVTLVSSDAGQFVRALKQKPGKGICVFGGGDFARSLLEADVIDEVGFNVHPVLLGSGVPALLDAHRRIDLELTECRQIEGGCVLVNYRVKRARSAQAAKRTSWRRDVAAM
jgi:dihydrofolate reductase